MSLDSKKNRRDKVLNFSKHLKTFKSVHNSRNYIQIPNKIISILFPTHKGPLKKLYEDTYLRTGPRGGSLTIFRVPWSRVWCASATDVFLGKWRNELMHRKKSGSKKSIFVGDILIYFQKSDSKVIFYT